jgi:putative ABC transport system ATP-binding protein
MSTPAAITVERVCKSFPGPPPVAALRQVSFEMAAGTLCLIAGPSGSGKSTLLGIVAGLEPPESGCVRHFGQPVSRRSSNGGRRGAEQARVGIVFQDAKLIGALTAEENVSLPLRLRGYSRRTARRRSRALLAQLGLAARARQRPLGLSGGEQQRIGLARALVTEPNILLADEPTANLDTASGLGVMHLLRAAARRWGAAVILVSHDGRLAANADRVFDLVDGRLTERREGRCRPE